MWSAHVRHGFWEINCVPSTPSMKAGVKGNVYVIVTPQFREELTAENAEHAENQQGRGSVSL